MRRNISFPGIVELDESYFGARHILGKRGRGASGKTIVFGLLKQDGKFIPKLFLIAPKSRCKALSVGILSLTQSSIQMEGGVMMALLILALTNI